MEEKITEYRALLIDENNKKFNGVAIFEEDGFRKKKQIEWQIEGVFKSLL